MDRCPPEIWAKICAIACTDDGRTGRSLSLVSHAFMELSRPYKLQSITVVGYYQLIAFAALLERLPAYLRRVTRIYISNQICSTTKSIGAPSWWSSSRKVTSFDVKRDAYRAAERILRALAPSVKVMHAFLTAFPRKYRSANLLPVSMPILEELVVHGPLGLSQEATRACDVMRFPALRRLELTFVCPPSYVFDTALQQAPNATHLAGRADGLDSGWAGLAAEATAQKQVGGSALPRQLEKICIYRPTHLPDDDSLAVQSTLRALDDLAEVDKRVALLRPLQEDFVISAETAMRMWNADDSCFIPSRN